MTRNDQERPGAVQAPPSPGTVSVIFIRAEWPALKAVADGIGRKLCLRGRYHELSSYDDRKSSFRTWLFRIGTYKVIDARRKVKVTWLELKDVQWVEEKDFDESLCQKELLGAINQYVASFRPEIQEVFRLRVYGELSFPEIASLLAQKEERIKAQYYRLVKKIREEFREHE